MPRTIPSEAPKWAVIFDWDGVIVDSRAHHEEAWRWMVAQRGEVLPTGFFLKSFGIKKERAITDLLGWQLPSDELSRLIQSKEALYRTLFEQKGAAPLAGVVDFLTVLRTNEVPFTIASSTPRKNIDFALPLLGLQSYYADIVVAEDVVHGKPNPEVFLFAARKLGIAPDRCVVIEDAPMGIEAGLAAGMKVVAVTTTNPIPSLQKAHVVLSALGESVFERIRPWFKKLARRIP